MPISLCTLLDSNVTEPFQPFAFHQASRHKINTAEATYQPHIYSIILHPSAPFLHLPSILTSCPLKPIPFAPLPQSLFPHVLTRSHSLSLPPLFLSIHTTESLLIICDLLKYIHCQSLSFPLSLTHFAFPLALALSLPGFLFGKPPCITHSLSLSTFSFFCLSVLQDNLSPPPPPPLCTAEKSQTLWDMASWSACMSACWKRGMNLAFYSTNRTMSTIAAVETFQRVPAMLNILHYLIPNCIK